MGSWVLPLAFSFPAFSLWAGFPGEVVSGREAASLMEAAVGAVEDGAAVIPGAVSAGEEVVSGVAELLGIGRFFC